jgi:hypothetical protein
MNTKRIYRTVIESGAPVRCEVVAPESVKDEEGVIYIEAFSMVAALRSANGLWTRGVRKRFPEVKRSA